MRAPETIFNTHIKQVKGVSYNSNGCKKAKINVRFTSDDSGETLSLSDDRYMLIVPFNKVMELVEETRKDRAKA